MLPAPALGAAGGANAESDLGWLTVFVPVVGGLRGHGIPEAMEAILFARSRMDPKVGAEGPIIMTARPWPNRGE